MWWFSLSDKLISVNCKTDVPHEIYNINFLLLLFFIFFTFGFVLLMKGFRVPGASASTMPTSTTGFAAVTVVQVRLGHCWSPLSSRLLHQLRIRGLIGPAVDGWFGGRAGLCIVSIDLSCVQLKTRPTQK